ncbi:hypothetical protein [Campylobacter sp. CCUG 57310]|uniref:hypothetical protein n=1 Tax=Campylobacter sp. CCUG 57310 TaxID=2517362 RepID=UPI0015635B8A|nr:hypothetical protein [Campylobacter sp. CCUG 57310]QKF91580.1 hypothetical protein CORI_0350 [Campylobacter sp. CCUG 57310]
MSKDIEMDGLILKSDPCRALDLLKAIAVSLVEKNSCNNQTILAVSLVPSIIESARELILPFFENYMFVDADKYKFRSYENHFTYDRLTGTYDYDESYLQLVEKIKKRKGCIQDNIDYIAETSKYLDGDLYDLGYCLFMYIVAKINSLICQKHKGYRSVINSFNNLTSAEFYFLYNYKAMAEDRYYKYEKDIQNTLKKISKYRNLKIDERIKRNEFISAINTAIKIIIDDLNYETTFVSI